MWAADNTSPVGKYIRRVYRHKNSVMDTRQKATYQFTGGVIPIFAVINVALPNYPANLLPIGQGAHQAVNRLILANRAAEMQYG